MGVTYATGRYVECESMQAVIYDGVSDTFHIIWNDGEVNEREIDDYFSIQSLDNGSIIEF
jgi:hypothetical protein